MADDIVNGVNQRLRFSVDLRPGETTIVSWKKLTREPNNICQSSGTGIEAPVLLPVVNPRIALGISQGSNEELDHVRDDNHYDRKDSFIDDTELDYFQVDKPQTKHNSVLVNRQLERVDEPLPSPRKQPKKRRKNILGIDTGEKTMKLLEMDGTPNKIAARNASLAVNKTSVPYTTNSSGTERYHTPNTATHAPNSGNLEKNHVDATIMSEVSWLARFPVTAELSSSDHKIFSENSSPVQFGTPQKNASIDVHELAMRSNLQSKEQSKRNIDFGGMQYRGSKYPRQNMKSPSVVPKEGNGLRIKGTMLERAIRELETTVAESRPPTVDVQDSDAPQGVKRRLPREVKQKLAKVARLAQSSQGRISEELINRLMSILGHLIQLKTLKRNLKAMVKLGLFVKQEKEDRFQQIKRELMEMIRTRASALKVKEGIGSDNKETLKGIYTFDFVTEDRLYDLYNLYVEGMDEDKGPQIRKLYVELAELWPEGWIDTHAIKHALSRAKERKRSAYNLQQHGSRIRKKRISSARANDSTKGIGNFTAEHTPFAHRTSKEKHLSNSNIQELTFLALPAPLNKCISNGDSLIKQNLDVTKLGRIASRDYPEEWHRVDVTLLEGKKPKVDPEAEVGCKSKLHKVSYMGE